MLTTLAVCVVGFAPGLLLGFVLPPGRDRLVAWSAAPILTLGLVTISMGWLQLTGLPSGATPVFVLELALALAAVLMGWLVRRHRSDGSHPEPIWRLRETFRAVHRRQVAALGAASAMSLAFGWLLLGRLSTPPGWDAMNHAFLTRRIIDTGSSAAVDVCVSGNNHGVLSCAFYPLAGDVEWAQAALFSPGDISQAMGAWSLVIVPLAMTLSIYACIRRLGGSEAVAGLGAAATAVLGPVWLSFYMGRITQFVGPTLAVSTALLLALAVTGRHPRRLGLLAGVASAGIMLTHTYDVVFVVVLGIAFVGSLYTRSHPLRRAASGLAAAAATAVFGVLPFASAILGASSARISSKPRFVGEFGQAVSYWVTDPTLYATFGYPAQGHHQVPLTGPVTVALVCTVLVLLAAPLSIFFAELKWARPWLFIWLVFSAIGIWTTSSTSGPAQTLAGLWYGSPDRLKTMVRPVDGLLAVAGAAVIALVARKAVIRIRGRALAGGLAHRTAALGALALVLVVGTTAATPGAWRPIRVELGKRVFHGPSYDRTFHWLAQHTDPGKVVGYDRHVQFMTWSYADFGVRPLWGIPSLLPQYKSDTGRRYGAFMWLADTKKGRSSGCEVQRLGIQYVVVGGPDIPGWRQHYDRKRIKKSPRLTAVHHDGAITVYEVTPLGRACHR